MFKLTLQDIALGWFETESPNWLTEDQMKQAFLKRFNPWGDTRHQQQDAWNKLKFDMTKDDVDVFVVDMKMLASILSYDEVIMEKFKDIFPDPNIEAALIAMDNFAAMQTKAKQLVQIYKPKHDSTMASAAILVHNADNSSTKNENLLPKSNQHQLPPIYPTPEQTNRGDGEYGRGQGGRVHGLNCGPHGWGSRRNSDSHYDQQDHGQGHGKGKRDFQDNRDRGQDRSFSSRRRHWDNIDSNSQDRDNRDRNGGGQGNNNNNRGRRWEGSRGQGQNDRGRGRKWNPNPQYSQQHYPDPNHYQLPPMGQQYRYPIPYEQYSPYPPQPQYPAQRPPAQSWQATNICQLCQNQGYYDYQCQFAGDFMARTQKAFNQGQSYYHQDPNQGDLSNGENDNNDPGGEPFQ